MFCDLILTSVHVCILPSGMCIEAQMMCLTDIRLHRMEGTHHTFTVLTTQLIYSYILCTAASTINAFKYKGGVSNICWGGIFRIFGRNKLRPPPFESCDKLRPPPYYQKNKSV